MTPVAAPDIQAQRELALTESLLRDSEYPLSTQKVHAYLRLILRWSDAYNLTAAADYEQLLRRHFLDSLAIAPWLQGSRVLDVGTGAGFPGIPLAMAFPDRRFELLDSNGKKCRFLFQARTELGLDNVMIRHARVEAYRAEQQPDCILSRAFSSLARLCELLRPVCQPGTRLLCMKGRSVESELAQIPDDYQLDLVQALPGANRNGAHLVVISKSRQASEHL